MFLGWYFLNSRRLDSRINPQLYCLTLGPKCCLVVKKTSAKKFNIC